MKFPEGKETVDMCKRFRIFERMQLLKARLRAERKARLKAELKAKQSVKLEEKLKVS